jgi:hormone-sensitive lipase
MTFLEKKRNKGKRLKIKMLYNQATIDLNMKENVSELLPIKTDVIFFITGGGFVSDFEKISQYYLREIVKDNDIPIFIIKYRYIQSSFLKSRKNFLTSRVAPNVKFPSPLNDVINGYLGTVNAFSSKINRVVMMGDSAGGNLICACVNFLILNGLKKPDKLLLLYPALVLNVNFFSPSILKAYNDEMINYFHLQYVLLLYLGTVYIKSFNS